MSGKISPALMARAALQRAVPDQHTPGPWHRNIKPARKYCVIFAGRNKHVAAVKTDGLTDAEIEANCNLITAAPDMLLALQIIALHASSLDTRGIRELCDEAIAKATGALGVTLSPEPRDSPDAGG